MLKEEIALQLTLAKIDTLCLTVSCASSPSSQNAEFNKALGEQIAHLYNSIYNNLDCYKSSQDDTFSSNDDMVVI